MTVMISTRYLEALAALLIIIGIVLLGRSLGGCSAYVVRPSRIEGAGTIDVERCRLGDDARVQGSERVQGHRGAP